MSSEYPSEEEYQRTVGILAQAAAKTDIILFSAFCAVSKLDPALARAIYFTAEAIAIRRQIVQNVTQEFSASNLDLIKKIADKAQTAQRQRNELAHSIVIRETPESKPMRYTPKNRHQPMRDIDQPYLDSLLTESLTAQDDAYEYFRELSTRLGIPPKLYA